MRHLWGRQWALAALAAVAVVLLDQMQGGGIGSALARGDRIVLSFSAAVLVAAGAMAWAAWMALRSLPCERR